MMRYSSLSALARSADPLSSEGAIALVIAEDTVLLTETLAHLQRIGVNNIVLCADANLRLDLPDHLAVKRVDFDQHAPDGLQDVINTAIKVFANRWIYWGYNAEFLYFPFCESRSLDEMLTFVTEERRDAVTATAIDLYAQNLDDHPDGVDLASACFDKAGYYATPEHDDAGHALERQLQLHGGLRWRFEEHIPEDRQRIDRICLFRARPGLAMLPNRRFNMAEYNTYACPWHNSLTAAVATFRTAKALRRNSGSRSVITTFHWPQSIRFEWGSSQLLDLGMMEPGQWF